jgi:hypothetical protein
MVDPVLMMTQEWQKEEVCLIPPVFQRITLEPVSIGMNDSSSLTEDELVECHDCIRTKSTSG